MCTSPKSFITQMTENKKSTLWKLRKVKIFSNFLALTTFYPSFYSPPLKKKINGWEKTEAGYRLIPDSKANIEKRESIFQTMMKKCKCKKTECKNGRCACFNAKMSCSSFCECLNCSNPHSKEARKPREDSERDGSITEEDSDDVQ